MAKIVRLVIPKWAICHKVSASHTEVCPFLACPQVSLVFRGNRAIFAPVMYISSLDACSWFNNSGLYFNTNITETWSFMSAEWVTLSFTLFSYSQSPSHSLSLQLLFLFSSPFFLPHILILPFLLSFFLNSHSTYSTQAKLHFGKWITNLFSSWSSDWFPTWSPWALHSDWRERSQDRHTISVLTVPGKEQHRWQHGGGEYRQHMKIGYVNCMDHFSVYHLLLFFYSVRIQVRTFSWRSQHWTNFPRSHTDLSKLPHRWENVASFSGLSWLQFLIACSYKNRAFHFCIATASDQNWR